MECEILTIIWAALIIIRSGPPSVIFNTDNRSHILDLLIFSRMNSTRGEDWKHMFSAQVCDTDVFYWYFAYNFYVTPYLTFFVCFFKLSLAQNWSQIALLWLRSELSLVLHTWLAFPLEKLSTNATISLHTSQQRGCVMVWYHRLSYM